MCLCGCGAEVRGFGTADCLRGPDVCRLRRFGTVCTIATGSASGGGISDNGCCSYDPSVAVAPDGTPYVAWSDSGGIYVRRWVVEAPAGETNPVYLPIIMK